MQYGRGLDRERTDKFVGMYVNDLTLDYGDRGQGRRRALSCRGVGTASRAAESRPSVRRIGNDARPDVSHGSAEAERYVLVRHAGLQPGPAA